MSHRDSPSMKAPGGLDYLTCNIAQLGKYIKARTGQKPRKGLKKATLAERLQALDRAPGIFRFLDLPAELRNNVYEELLTLRSRRNGGDYCFPEILQVSKQTSSEARGILYAGNKCKINIRCHEFSDGKIYCRSNVLSGNAVRRQSSNHELGTTREFWPVQVLQFSSLDVTIRIKSHEAFRDEKNHKLSLACSVNNTLFSLCGFLSSSSSLKEINVKLSIQDDVPSQWLLRPLWPLSCVSKTVRMKTVGCPIEVEEMLTARPPPSDETIATILDRPHLREVVSPADLAINWTQDNTLAKLRAAYKKYNALEGEISALQTQNIRIGELDQRRLMFPDWLQKHTLIDGSVEVGIRAHLIMFSKQCTEVVASVDRAMAARMADWQSRRKLLLDA